MTDQPTENATRGKILRLLSDEELARVCLGETTLRLADGDEYLDLEHPSHGVQRASGEAASMSSLVPRRLVSEETWARIVKHLEPPRRPSMGRPD